MPLDFEWVEQYAEGSLPVPAAGAAKGANAPDSNAPPQKSVQPKKDSSGPTQSGRSKKRPHESDHANTGSSTKRARDTVSQLSKAEQCVGYALECLSSGLLRTHAIGALVHGNKLQMWYYDRSIIATAAFNFTGDIDKFIRWLRVISELPAPGSSIFRTPTNVLSKGDLSDEEAGPHWGKVLRIEGLPNMDIVLLRTLYRQHGIIGRGTVVVQGQFVKKPSPEERAKWFPNGHKFFIVKISSPSASRISEKTLVDKAMKMASEEMKRSLPNIYFEITIEDGTPNLKALFGDAYELRALRLNFQEPLQKIQTITHPLELAYVYVDLVTGKLNNPIPENGLTNCCDFS